MGDTEDKVLFLNSGSSYEKNVKTREDVCLIKHGLRIPKVTDTYEEFVDAIGISERLFVSCFENIGVNLYGLGQTVE